MFVVQAVRDVSLVVDRDVRHVLKSVDHGVLLADHGQDLSYGAGGGDSLYQRSIYVVIDIHDLYKKILKNIKEK